VPPNFNIFYGIISGLENRDYGIKDPLHDNPHLQKFALTSPTCCGRSVGIVRRRIKAMEFKVTALYHRRDYISDTEASVNSAECLQGNALILSYSQEVRNREGLIIDKYQSHNTSSI
jgi:hypothetical protein